MIWKAGSCSKSIRFLALGIGALLVSGCVSEEARQQGLIGLDKFEISAPEITDNEALKEITALKDKVSHIEIVAPGQGDRLGAVRAEVSSGYDSWKIGADYLLADNMEPVVREASTYLFELDPNAEKHAKITLLVDVGSALNNFADCKPWLVRVTVEFLITEVSTEANEVTNSYHGSGVESQCTTWVGLPWGDAVEDPFHEAFAKALLKATSERQADASTVASVN